MKWIKKVAVTPLDAISKVVDSIKEQTNDRTNAPSIHAVREALAANSLSIYPVGSIYMCVNDINPSEFFGGTWVQIKDRFLLAAGDTYNNGETGGEATTTYTPAGTVGGHSLTIAEMPNHSHNVTYGLTRYGNVEGDSYLVGDGVKNIEVLEYQAICEAVGENQAHNHSFAGTEATLENMPPYLTVNVWKRTA